MTTTTAPTATTDGFYRTGQVAKELSISDDQVRALCEAGLIRGAELTDTGHWRIPSSEATRLSREGIPPIPQPLPEGGEGTRPPHSGAPLRRPQDARNLLLSDPSDGAIHAAEDVLVASHELNKMRIDLEKIAVQDKLDAHKLAKEISRQNEREAARQKELEEARPGWLQKWMQFALRSLPAWAVEAQGAIHTAVTKRLAELGPETPDWQTEQVIRVETAQVLHPYDRAQKFEKLLDSAVYRLPSEVQRDPKYGLAAQSQAARKEAQLRPAAGERELEVVISACLKICSDAYDHDQHLQKFIRAAKHEAFLKLSRPEEERMVEAISKALAAVPIGSDERVMKTAYDAAMVPFRAQIVAIQDAKLRAEVLQYTASRLPSGTTTEDRQTIELAVREYFNQAPPGTGRAALEEMQRNVIAAHKLIHEQKQNRKRLVDIGLAEIPAYLARVEDRGDFEGNRTAAARELQAKIRPLLESEIDKAEVVPDEATVLKAVRL